MMLLLQILAVSSITALLAALLVVAQRFVANYGQCKVTINDAEPLTVEGGISLLESLTQNKIFIPSACGGRGTCAYCKLKVLEGGGAVLPTEEPFLDADERAAGMRLSCQVKVKNDVAIQIPDELFAIKEYECTCAEIKDLTHDVKEFTFAINDADGLEYVPGQYIQLFCPAYDNNEEVYRAYSVSSDPAKEGAFELVIRLVPGGICTTWCFEHLAEGDRVRINGPYGDFKLSDTDAPMIFIAGGSGMAPIKCMLHHMQNSGNSRKATYFFGANRVDELFYGELMKQFEDELANFRFVPVVSQPGEGEQWDGEEGLVTDALRRDVADASGHEAYLCGSPGMINASVDVLVELGIDRNMIYFDEF